MYQEISFPSLGLSFNPSRVAFSIGSKDFYWYGVIIAVGFLLAVWYALRRCRQFGITQDNLIDMLICAVPTAVVCARAYYCIFEWDLYKSDPIRVLYIWEGGLAIYGGIIGSVLALTIYTKVKKIKTSAMLDIGGLGLLIGQSIGRWGNFINREAHGGVTDTFLRMGLTDSAGNTTYVHPTFLYESLWNALGLLILHFLSKRRKYDGQIFVMYLGWYGLGRVFIEGLRTDSLYLMGTNLRISQLVAGLCVVFAVVFLFVNKVFREHDPEDLYVNRVAAKAAAAETVEAEETAEPAEAPEEKIPEETAEEPTEEPTEEPAEGTEE
jgi:phosphatidylglycerol:prolipoprotein diacylglycerol transferase